VRVQAVAQAVVRLPEASLGVFVTGGLMATLAAYAGVARAKALMLLGEEFSAAQAHAWGLVWHVVPPEELEAASARVADKLAASGKRLGAEGAGRGLDGWSHYPGATAPACLQRVARPGGVSLPHHARATPDPRGCRAACRPSAQAKAFAQAGVDRPRWHEPAQHSQQGRLAFGRAPHGPCAERGIHNGGCHAVWPRSLLDTFHNGL